MGEIGPRRIAVFIGLAYHKSYMERRRKFSPLGKVGLLRK